MKVYKCKNWDQISVLNSLHFQWCPEKHIFLFLHPQVLGPISSPDVVDFRQILHTRPLTLPLKTSYDKK